MTTYVMVRYRVSDEAAYARYRELAGPVHGLFGGKLVAKGADVEVLEGGDGLPNFVLLEFPDSDAARGWYHSDDYQSARAVRGNAGDMTISIIEG
ncbi:MAG TPA: DUF1330 domain-containing protein [Acidimicrobiales bacterium]|nr:DUF1330 domain-containing protein [Acidimicrobiales bacterium]